LQLLVTISLAPLLPDTVGAMRRVACWRIYSWFTGASTPPT
jgi:hypothetical protein